MLKFEVNGSLATLLMSRPPVNAISDEWMTEFAAILDRLDRSPEIGVFHIRSDQKVFCAGADLTQVRDYLTVPGMGDGHITYVRRLQDIYNRLEKVPQVTVAEINGAALGGGFELALACDLRVVSTAAKVGLPEARLGLLPGAGGTQRLTRLCGYGVAARIILGAEPVSGEEACKLGMVQWAVAPDQLAAFTAEVVERIRGLPPASLAACKRCMMVAVPNAETGYWVEVLESRRLIDNPATRERVSAFLNK